MIYSIGLRDRPINQQFTNDFILSFAKKCIFAENNKNATSKTLLRSKTYVAHWRTAGELCN